MKNNWLFTFILSLLAVSAEAQSGRSGFFYEDGKMMVVVAVIAVILLGIFLYLFRLDRKISKLEKEEE